MKGTVLKRAKANLEKELTRMRYTHEIGRKCMRYIAGDQWDDAEKQARGDDRPMITINRLSPFVNNVVNKNIMERARIKVAPFEDSDVEKAKVVNGLIRHIQYAEESDATTAYSWAYFCLVTCGFGYWRVASDYVDEMSVDEQELSVEPLEDPFLVFVDKDRKYAFVISFMDKDEYEKEYGAYEGAEWSVPQLIDGAGENDVMVVEYWELSQEDTDIYKIDVPEMITIDAPDASIDGAIEQATQPRIEQTPAGVRTVTAKELETIPEYRIIGSRKTTISKVTRYLFCGDKTAKENEWDGKRIPIVGIYAREFTTDSGDKFFKPLVYDSLDAQKMYNFYRTQDAELMSLVPKAVWQGAEGQFAGHEDQYDNAHLDTTSRLEYKPVTANGQLAPPPERLPPPMPSAGYYQNIATAADEIKATMGMYNPLMGVAEQAMSGRAKLADIQQGDLSTYHFVAAFNRGLRLTGVILVDLIPFKYDTARSVRILGEDMADEIVHINQAYTDKDGKNRLYDLTTGRYDVSIEIGPSSATRRMEAVENLLEFVRVVPQAAAVSGDFVAKNMDMEYSDELAARLKAMIPQQLLDRVQQMQSGQNGGPKPEQIALMQAQQQLAKAVQAVQGLAQENQQLKGKISSDKIVIEQIRAKAGITEEQIRAATDIAIARMRQQPIPMPTGGDGNPITVYR